jgi:hypothetical protein
MHLLRHRLTTTSLTIVVLALCCVLPCFAKKKPDTTPRLRWAEGSPGCTFDRGNDGKYRWGLWADDMGVTIAVDSQELQLSRHRDEPMFGVLVTIRYRGTGSLDVRNDNLSIEYVDHQHDIKSSLDPDDLATRLQKKIDDLNDNVAHTLKKHPEKKQELESQVQTYEKEITDLQEFLADHSLRPTTLDATTPQVSGWVFFTTRSRWIGDWKQKEHFIVRMPYPGKVFEFPFSLPPIEGDLILRKRPE